MTTATVTERSVSELITVSDGIASITPFIYSMIMWKNVDDQPGEPFAERAVDVPRADGTRRRMDPLDRYGDVRPAPRPALGDGRRDARHRCLRDRPADRRPQLPAAGTIGGVRDADRRAGDDRDHVRPGAIIKAVVALTKKATDDDDGASIAGWVTWG